MKTNILTMSIEDLSVLENLLSTKLETKLRLMKYDEELEELYQEIEQVTEEIKRRKESV